MATKTTKSMTRRTRRRRKNRKKLVIVESPSKAKTVGKFLGRSYRVVASKGHVRDLPKSKMGVDIKHNYAPHYISIRGKGATIKMLRSEARKAKQIYLASDPDREGEAIAWHLSHLLKLDVQSKDRVSFNQITRDTVRNSFKHPRTIDMNLVNAQQARRILDRLVGYSISPILWRKVRKGLSAGRVQSIALWLVIQREREIEKFKPQEYWTIDLNLKKARSEFVGHFFGVNGKKRDLHNDHDVRSILKQVDNKLPLKVTKIKKRVRHRHPTRPFTTSTMQQAANRKLHFRTGRTMMAAQELFEGVKIGRHGHQGLITYMRTDSTRIASVAEHHAARFITDNFGKEYAANPPAKVKTSKDVQDAHEAIRPTSVKRVPSKIKRYLTRDQYRLYNLIWAHFVASQMTSAKINTLTLNMEQHHVDFKAHRTRLIFPGFLSVYGMSDRNDRSLPEPDLRVGDTVNIISVNPDQHFTQPPARYSEANLIHALEKNGVGRPSTYSPTLMTIQKRYYVRLRARRFRPTKLGKIVNKIIEHYFPDIVNIDFTADLESKLDQIAEAKRNWVKVIDQFYKPFSKELNNAQVNMKDVQAKDKLAGFNCDICGAPMVIKWGRYGKFYACSRFPACRNTKPIIKKIGVVCPKCKKGQVIVRKSKRGRKFYGCSRYPDCNFVSWNRPVNRKCPKDGHFLVERKIRGGYQVVCPNGDYEEKVQK